MPDGVNLLFRPAAISIEHFHAARDISFYSRSVILTDTPDCGDRNCCAHALMVGRGRSTVV